jgi:hypothetical protein
MNYQGEQRRWTRMDEEMELKTVDEAWEAFKISAHMPILITMEPELTQWEWREACFRAGYEAGHENGFTEGLMDA